MFAIAIWGDRHGSYVILLFWCPLFVCERSPIELTIDCRGANVFAPVFGPTAVPERVFLSFNPSVIVGGPQEAKNKTSAPTCATIDFGTRFTDQRAKYRDQRRVDSQHTGFLDSTAIAISAIV